MWLCHVKQWRHYRAGRMVRTEHLPTISPQHTLKFEVWRLSRRTTNTWGLAVVRRQTWNQSSKSWGRQWLRWRSVYFGNTLFKCGWRERTPKDNEDRENTPSHLHHGVSVNSERTSTVARFSGKLPNSHRRQGRNEWSWGYWRIGSCGACTKVEEFGNARETPWSD